MMLDGLYEGLPTSLQHLACTLYGIRERRVRMSPEFWRRLEWLQETETWSREAICAYQDEMLHRLITHAYETVPYYRNVMNERGLMPRDITSRADLVKLPVLTKERVVGMGRELRSRKYQERQLIAAKTSGTTGTALSFRTTREAVAFQWAVWWRHRLRFGVEPLSWHVNFTGKPIVPIGQDTPPFWRWNWAFRQALVNMTHLVPEKIAPIVDFVNQHDFIYFSGYPSIVHRFASLISEKGLELSKQPQAVFLGAEKVLDFQREAIETATGAIVTDQYGFSEGCGNASRCPYGLYHEDWEYCILEAKQSHESASEGPPEILATGFANWGFPFIRYEVGDVANFGEPGVCACGRASRVLNEIEGRSEDYVLTPEGTRVMRFDYAFKETWGVKEAQVVQKQKGQVIIRIVPRASFDAQDEQSIRRTIKQWISPGLEVEFELVREIPRSRNGKFRAVVSELTDGARLSHSRE